MGSSHTAYKENPLLLLLLGLASLTTDALYSSISLWAAFCRMSLWGSFQTTSLVGHALIFGVLS
jgi:hypothetical protein